MSFLLNPYIYYQPSVPTGPPEVVGTYVADKNATVSYSTVGSWQPGDLAIVVVHQFTPTYVPTGYTQIISPTPVDTYNYKKSVSYRVLQSGDTSVQMSDDTVGFDSTLIILRNVDTVSSNYDWDYTVGGNSTNLSVAEDGVAIAIASDRGATTGGYPSISISGTTPDLTNVSGAATYFEQRHNIYLNYTSGTNITFTDYNDTYGSNYLVIVASSSGGGGGGAGGATPDIELLLAAGGGAGAFGGGAGAGGLIYDASYSVAAATDYTVTVGAGAAAKAGGNYSSVDVTTDDGSNSVFNDQTAVGGNGGGSSNETSPGTDGVGGSGGGGAYNCPAGTGTAGQGNNGGAGLFNSGYGVGGGGGGAAQIGDAASNRVAGNGGNGAQYSIEGSALYYAGGGGGSSDARQAAAVDGPGGLGGGGDGLNYRDGGGAAAESGSPNTGGGGGGSYFGSALIHNDPGSGGSGVVILAYPDTYDAPSYIDPGLTYSEPTRSGYRVYKFTAGTGTIRF